jgi:hypothetical protein
LRGSLTGLLTLLLLPVRAEARDFLVRVADELLAALAHRLGAVDIDLDIALDVFDTEDLVVDRSEGLKNEVKVPKEHGPSPRSVV